VITVDDEAERKKEVLVIGRDGLREMKWGGSASDGKFTPCSTKGFDNNKQTCNLVTNTC
jgi:hypothetical protein